MSGDTVKQLVLLKVGATSEDVKAAGKLIDEAGGQNKKFLATMNGFTVEMPAGIVSTLKTSDLISSIESDGVVNTQ